MIRVAGAPWRLRTSLCESGVKIIALAPAEEHSPAKCERIQSPKVLTRRMEHLLLLDCRGDEKSKARKGATYIIAEVKEFRLVVVRYSDPLAIVGECRCRQVSHWLQLHLNYPIPPFTIINWIAF